MTSQLTNKQAAFLSSVTACRYDRWLALAIVTLSLVVFVALVPFAREQLPAVWAFIPIYQSALAINDLVTAVILFGQYSILRTRALLVLAAGYLCTAFIMVSHGLSFPGLFSPTGLLGTGAQTTVWLYMFWHGIFPIAVIAYALLKDKTCTTNLPRRSAQFVLSLTIAATFAVVVALTLIATVAHDLLPNLMQGHKTKSTILVAVSIIVILCLCAIAILWLRRPHTVLDLWLIVVMCAWIFDMMLSAGLNAGRFDLGFYAGRAYGLLASTIVLVILLLETGALYAQLVRLFAAEQQEHRLEAEERRRLFETSLDLILIVDRKGTLLRVSPSSTEILGYEPAEMVGYNAINFVFPDDLNAIRAEMQRARHGHHIRNFATRYVHKDERIVMLAWSGVWSEPEQRHFFIGRDVTEQKRIEGMKDEFIATVSHELRTPLTSIAGPLGLLMGGAGGDLPESAKRLITIAQANSKRLAGLINDILDIDKIESGKMTFNFQRVDLKNLLEQAIEVNRPIAEKHNVRVRSDIVAFVFYVRTDSDRLMQVIANLLSNAVKFSPPSGEVMVSIETRNEHFRICVLDRGPGIPDDVKTRLFEKFTRGDATDTRQKDGTGLGLCIVKEIMTRLEGNVGYNSVAWGGTIFHVDVPRWDAASLVERAPELSIKAA